MKHHNIHKTTKIHVFHKNSSKKITDTQAKLKYVTKKCKKLENWQNFMIFLVGKNLTFSPKKCKIFAKKSEKMFIFWGEEFLINPGSG